MSLPGSPLLFVLAVVAALCAVEGTRAVWRALAARRRRLVRLRLYGMAEPAAVPDDESLLLRRSGGSWIERVLQRLAVRNALALELRRAELTTTPGRFVALSLALGWLGAQAVWWWAPAASWALLGAALGLAPWALVRRRSHARARRFEEQFPEALDLLIRALRAGHSLSAGFQLVGEELADPVGGEFSQISTEVRLGQPVKRALDNLVLRIGNPDVAFFATAVAVQQETGSNLVEVLDNLARVIRSRFQLLGKVRALTSLGRASANLLVVWPAVMVGMLWLVNADYVAPLWQTPAGHSMLLLSAALVGIGYALCRRMARIRV